MDTYTDGAGITIIDMTAEIDALFTHDNVMGDVDVPTIRVLSPADIIKINTFITNGFVGTGGSTDNPNRTDAWSGVFS